MKVVRDPKGNVMKLHLLQVLDRDEQGPLTLRCRRDNETVQLAGEDSRNLVFWMVWAPENDVLGELQINDVIGELDTAKADLARGLERLLDMERANNALRGERDTMEAKYKDISQGMRELQKQLDPEREAVRVAEAVKAQTASLEESLRLRNKTIADLERENEELRASKRRLKEANERLKDGRK